MVSLHHKDRDVHDVLTDFERLRIVVALRRAHENRPEPAVEQQGAVHLLVGAIPVGLNFHELSVPPSAASAPRFRGAKKIGRCERRLHGTFTTSNWGFCTGRRLRAAQVLYGVVFKIGLAAVSIYVENRANRSVRASKHSTKNGGVSPAVWLSFHVVRDQRSSCSTLCCDWLASASAETAIDWRVDSAWLLAASSFGSASVRFDAPVCSTLIRFLLKS